MIRNVAAITLICAVATGPAHSLSSGLPTHTVALPDGSAIRGYKRIVAMQSVWHYHGVPFAEPPVGPLRFKRPVARARPVGSAERPFDAFVKPPACYYWPLSPMSFERDNPALMMWWNNTQMSEDCLFLNIWTPTADTGQAKAVMVWIYGGGFYAGSSSLEVYDGAVLASKGDVVVVSMQYRMGALGFLHLDDGEAPGNVGLNDQLLAMQWVKRNIRYFGGDDSRITIFGESAGGVSVSYHLLSPYSQQYFTRAIMQSGTAIAWWASEDRAMARQRAMHLASEVGCYIGHADRARIVHCLRSIDVVRLQQKTTQVLMLYNAARSQYYDTYWRTANRNAKRRPQPFMYFDLPFKPVYGTEFIPHDPKLILAKGNFKKTDLLMGVMKDEGVFWIVYALQNLFIHKSNWSIPFWWNQPIRDQDGRRTLPTLRGIDTERDPYELVARYFITSININNPLTEAISFEYQVPSKRFGDKTWRAKEVMDALDDLTSDRSFKCPVIDFAEVYQERLMEEAAARHRVWLYSFEHRSQNLPLPEWTGAMHGYEMDYVFGMPFNENFTRKFYGYTRAERILSTEVMQFWSNFAKTGNPNTADASRQKPERFMEWQPYRQHNKTHIVLKPKIGLSFNMGKNLRRRQCRFWSHHISNIRAYLKGAGRQCNGSVQPEPTSADRPRLAIVAAALAAALASLSQSERAF